MSARRRARRRGGGRGSRWGRMRAFIHKRGGGWLAASADARRLADVTKSAAEVIHDEMAWQPPPSC